MTLYERIAKASNNGEFCAVCTIIGTTGTTPRKIGSKMIVFQDGNVEGTIGGGEVENEITLAALDSIAEKMISRKSYPIDKTNKLEKDSLEILIEPIIPNTTLVIFGAGHVGKSTAFFAKKLGWHVIVVDNRMDLNNKVNIPEVDAYFTEINEQNHSKILRNYFNFIFCTRSSDLDVAILPKIIEIDPTYIGILGSSKRWANTQTALLNLGVSKQQIDKIHSPIGISIEAETPEEIAVSIIAEIIKIKNREI